MTEQQVIWETNLTPGMGFINGPKGQEAYTQALQRDKEKVYRVVVNIVGKERQGKTSLRRLFTNEPFNENEEGTVGIEEDLVQTKGVIPEAFWHKIDLSDANENEFRTMLSKHIKLRLRRSRSKLDGCISPIVLFGKILLIACISMWAFFCLLTCKDIRGYPWVTGFVIVQFVICAFIFGPKDGFGLAIGILHSTIHCEAIHRWQLHDYFDGIAESTSFTCSLLLSAVVFVTLESVIGCCLGMSIGLGVILAFCLASPPMKSYEDEVFPLQNMHVHLVITTMLIGMATVRYERVLFIIMGPLVAILVELLPREYCYTLMFGLAYGHTHPPLIGVGQKIYVFLNDKVKKKYIPSRVYRRYICHGVGLITGKLFTVFFQWTPADSITLHSLSVVILLATLEIVNILLKETETMNDPTKVVNVVDLSPTLKLIVRDFAGHPLYHSAHHVYMTGQNIYIIVFNLVEAKNNFEESCKNVIYWLQSIIVHDNYPRVRAFIVGTHRDNKTVSLQDLKNLSERFRHTLPRQFYNAVIWNDDNSPIFFVENAVRDRKDIHHTKLKDEIFRMASRFETMQIKYPIKLFFFYNVIEQYRKRSQLIENVDTVFQLCKTNTCNVQTFEEFENMLRFYHQSGELIFNTRDQRLRNVLIFDPRAFINLLSHIVTLPAFADRHQDYIALYEHLSETGVCSKKLLQHIIRQTRWKTELNFETIVALLESFDLLFETTDGQMLTHYIIPALIPHTLLNPNNYWQTEATDSTFYILFDPFLPNPLFLRLLARCATDKDNEPIFEDGLLFLNISEVNALLTSGGDFAYKIELSDTNTSQSRKDVRLVIRSRGYLQPVHLVNNVCRHIQNITDRHFTRCRFRITVTCPFPEPHDGSRKSVLLFQN